MIFTLGDYETLLAVLYDIHGNLVALEEVLKDAEAAGADAYLLGGDFGAGSPWPLETIDAFARCRTARGSAVTASAGCASRRWIARRSRRPWLR
jgi:hypothetical protein